MGNFRSSKRILFHILAPSREKDLMDVVDDVKQTEAYLTALRARKMANKSSANSSDSSENDFSTEEAC